MCKIYSDMLSPEKSQDLIRRFNIEPEKASINYNRVMSSYNQMYTKRTDKNVAHDWNSIFTTEDLINLVPNIPYAKFFITYDEKGFFTVGYKGKRGIYKKYTSGIIQECLYELLINHCEKRETTLEGIVEKHIDPSYYGDPEEISKIVSTFSLTEEIHKSLFKVVENTLLLDDPRHRLEYLVKCKLLQRFYESMDIILTMKQGPQHYGTVWEHTLDVIYKTKPNRIQRWAAFFHDLGKVYARKEENGKITFIEHEKYSEVILLRYSDYFNRFDFEKIRKIVLYHMRAKSWGNECSDVKPKHFYKLQYLLGNAWDDFLDVIDADNKSHSPEYILPSQKKNIIKISEKLPYSFQDYSLPIDRSDFRKLGIEEMEKCKEWLLKFAFSKPEITRDELIENIKTQWGK